MSDRQPKPCPNPACESDMGVNSWACAYDKGVQIVCADCRTRGPSGDHNQHALDLWDALLRRREVRDDLCAVIVSLCKQGTAQQMGVAENLYNAADAYRDAAECIGKLSLDYCPPPWAARPEPENGAPPPDKLPVQKLLSELPPADKIKTCDPCPSCGGRLCSHSQHPCPHDHPEILEYWITCHDCEFETMPNTYNPGGDHDYD